jgi:hypothetical protein
MLQFIVFFPLVVLAIPVLAVAWAADFGADEHLR